MYPTQRIIIYSFNFLQNFRSPTASSFHLLVYLRRYIWTPFAFSRLALCLVINSITLQFFYTPLQSHKRTIHYLKIEILVPNTRSNFDIPHIYSYLSRILNVIINLLRFLQRCRSPSPILTPAPHCSLHRYIIHTLINWSLSKSLVVATSFNKLCLPCDMHPDELALYLGEALLFWWQHAMNSMHRSLPDEWFASTTDGEYRWGSPRWIPWQPRIYGTKLQCLICAICPEKHESLILTSPMASSISSSSPARIVRCG